MRPHPLTAAWRAARRSTLRPYRVLGHFCLVLLACCGAAHAQLSLSNSRLVFQPGARQVEMVVTNESDRLATVQAWVDADEAQLAPEDTLAPFLVTPPSSKIRPGASQILRVNYTGAALTGDRERLYYLNILDIAPPAEKNAAANLMRLDVRSRFKVFMRPAGLRTDARAAAQSLRWRIGPAGLASPPPQGAAPAGGPSMALVADNPSPYFLTLVNVRLMQGQKVLQTFEPRMAAPFGAARFATDAADADWQQASAVAYEYLDDFGIAHAATQTLEPAQ